MIQPRAGCSEHVLDWIAHPLRVPTAVPGLAASKYVDQQWEHRCRKCGRVMAVRLLNRPAE
jgi:hypothetical protein